MTMANGYYSERAAENKVTFDVFYRKNPYGGGFTIFAGLEQIIEYIENLHFDADDIQYFHSLKMFSKEFLDYLKNYHFNGDIYAFPKGRLCIPMNQFSLLLLH